ncbi:MAG TPA: hypothetical protein VHL30_00180, partial [Chlamydiales bacterium]|nr:hypothetical protein [Chlamydiales bacterium]
KLPAKSSFITQCIRSLDIGIDVDFGLAVVVKIPPAKAQDEAYGELVCTEQDQSHITEIIKIMSENGKLGLLFRQNHLKQLGAQINHVHPLKFLETIFSNPESKASMRDIFEDYFKKTGFLDGLGPSLSREMEKGKLMQYVEDFSKTVGVSAEGIRPYFQTGDWEALVRYLINE